MSKGFKLTMDIYKQYKTRQLKKEVKPAVKDSVNYNMKDPNLKAEGEVNGPAETNEQATEAAESAAQDAATGASESGEEGGAEG